MDKSTHDELTKEIEKFVSGLNKKYNVGTGVLAIDCGHNGDICLGMMFGRVSRLNERLCDRLLETCESTIKGAKIEYKVGEKSEDIQLPDPTDRKAVARFVLEHDLLNDKGEVDKEKTDALFNKLIEQKKKEYIDDFLKSRKSED